MQSSKPTTIFRINNWWNYIIPPILGFAYMTIYLKNIEFTYAWKNLILFFVMIIGTAIFGFFYNDCTDIDFDKKAGKTNFASKFNLFSRVLILLGVIAIAIFPLLFLPFSILTISLFSFQFLLLLLYSHPFTRLKTHIYAGIISDALYSNFVFILLAIFTFSLLSKNTIPHFKILVILIAMATFLKGLRNILLHQIADRKQDRKTKETTFVTEKGGLFTIHFISQFILPLEIILFISISIITSLMIDFFFILPILFILFTISKYRFWEKLNLNKRHYQFMFLNVPNDFYEEWFPVYFLVILTIFNYYFGIILIIHLGLFSAITKKFIFDSTNIFKNHWKDFKAFKKKVLHI